MGLGVYNKGEIAHSQALKERTEIKLREVGGFLFPLLIPPGPFIGQGKALGVGVNQPTPTGQRRPAGACCRLCS